MGKKILHEPGEQFGRLTIIEQDSKTYPDHVLRWICKCECGNIISVKGTNLRNGTTRSCGCLAKELSSQRNTNDLTGQKFGHLTVLKRSDIKKGTSVCWECKCDCGNPTIKIIAGKHLTEKNGTKSCGCCPKTDLTVMPHDFLQAISYDFSTKKWNVKCLNCGSIVQMTNDTFRDSKSCGCIKSFGEFKIAKILNDNNISFEKEKIFKDFNPFRFDFYIVDKNYIIEYDGVLHYKYTGQGWNTQDSFKTIQEHDKIKNQWCKENNIPLIRIPYTHLNQICLEDLLLETSNFIIK